MITEFRKSLFQYLIILIFFTTLFIAFIFPESSPIGFLSPVTKFLLAVFSALIAHTIAAIISSKTGNKEFQLIANILMRDCDVEQFSQQSAPLLKKGSNQSNLVKYILLGNGYIAEGNFAKTLDLLETALSESNIPTLTEEMRVNLCLIYQNACISQVEMKQYKKAIITYSSLNEISQSINNSAIFKEQANDIKLLTRDYIGIFTKPTMDTSYLEESFTSTPTNFMKLLLAHLLKRHFQKVGGKDRLAIYNDYINTHKTSCFSSLSDL